MIIRFLFITHNFFTVLKCTEIVLIVFFFKIEGAKAQVYSIRAKYTPEILKKYFTLFVQMCFTKTFQTNAKCNIINNVRSNIDAYEPISLTQTFVVA